MVAGVGAGVVFVQVKGGMTDGADRPPTERAEVNDEVRCDVADSVVELLRVENERVEGLTFVVGDGQDLALISSRNASYWCGRNAPSGSRPSTLKKTRA